MRKRLGWAQRGGGGFLRPSVGVGLAIGALVAFPAGSLANQRHGADPRGLGPGCAPDRPAVAHYAGGVSATGQHGPAPIPCVVNTGLRTAEMSIGVTNNGTLLVPPAIPSGSLDQHLDGIAGTPVGVGRSTDDGATWNYVNPLTNPPRLTGVDMNLAVDRATGRVFWSSDIVNLGLLEVGGVNLGWVGPTLAQAPPRLDISDNNGRTWHSSATLPMLFDHTQIVTGRPTEQLRHLQRMGYPDVVYVVAGDGGLYCTQFHLISPCGAHITRSVDGGLTFGPSVPIPAPASCPNPGGGYGLHPAVGSDGTVYVPLDLCSQPYLAISHDEGATWQTARVANVDIDFQTMDAVSIDRDGNLFLTWVNGTDRLPYMVISRDGGLNWSAPLMVAAPGVKQASEEQLTVGPHGQVAMSYFGSRSAPGDPSATWNTYAAETFNPLSQRPLFWSATLNDPTEPVWYGAGGGADAGAPAGSSEFGQVDYFGMTSGPDGTPWVGFPQRCPGGLPVAGNPNCPSTLTGAPNDGVFALVGRLISRRG